jgi:hypothetical protein
VCYKSDTYKDGIRSGLTKWCEAQRGTTSPVEDLHIEKGSGDKTITLYYGDTSVTHHGKWLKI